ncbi:MAG: IMP dehydrogenase, partial [Planctomycetota bacterium]|nr:IMP dehydrogenase [Planctomycetota bacterium]
KGMITIKDIDKLSSFPSACKDRRGRLRVGAAVGVFDFERVESLIKAGVDVLVVDSAHGHSKNVIETVRKIKSMFSIDLIAGNVATLEGAKALVDAGADAVKVGIGPGSICTTRMISGVGVPQITAINQVAIGLKELAESPGQIILYKGRSFKTYRGMGSQGAMMAGSKDRYQQSGESSIDKLVPEGVEGRVPYKGPLAPFIYQLVGGLRAGMGYCGTKDIEELRTKTKFIQVSGASVVESHPHDISITHEAPNYSSRTDHAHSDSN